MSHKNHVYYGAQNHGLLKQLLHKAQGKDGGVEALSRVIQDVKDSAHWAQQVHSLNMEIRMARHTYDQVHSKMTEAVQDLQVSGSPPGGGSLLLHPLSPSHSRYHTQYLAQGRGAGRPAA